MKSIDEINQELSASAQMDRQESYREHFIKKYKKQKRDYVKSIKKRQSKFNKQSENIGRQVKAKIAVNKGFKEYNKKLVATHFTDTLNVDWIDVAFDKLDSSSFFKNEEREKWREYNGLLSDYLYELAFDKLEEVDHDALYSYENIQSIIKELEQTNKYNLKYSEEEIKTLLEKLEHSNIDNSLLKASKSVLNCSDFLSTEYFAKSSALDIQRINLCRNRFCPNCQWLLQASRLSRFAPAMDATAQHSNLYHVTLTIPNMAARDLALHVNVMFKIFPRLIDYMKGRKRIRGIPLPNGFKAAFRSFEITFKKDMMFHPHFHVILATDKQFELGAWEIKNAYSVSEYARPHKMRERLEKIGKMKNDIVYFSAYEVLIQKVWKLLFDNELRRTIAQLALDEKQMPDIKLKQKEFENSLFKLKKSIAEEDFKIKQSTSLKRVYEKLPFDEPQILRDGQAIELPPQPEKILLEPITRYAIDKLSNVDSNKAGDKGYTCQIDPISDDGSYMQAFKYICKITAEDSKEVMSYNQFVILHKVLKSRKVVQGYGEWFGLEQDDQINEKAELIYLSLVKYLRNNQDGDVFEISASYSKIEELINTVKNIKIFSKNNCHKLADDLKCQADKELIMEGNMSDLKR